MTKLLVVDLGEHRGMSRFEVRSGAAGISWFPSREMAEAAIASPNPRAPATRDLFAAPVPFRSPEHEAAHPLAGRYGELIAVASRYVPADVRVEMCRNPSVIMATFWLFRDTSQIAAVACEGAQWRASRMARGMPYAQQHFISLEDAIRYAAG